MQKIQKTTIVLFLLSFFLFSQPLFAQTSTSMVDVSLKLSLCGDGIVEGSEDCEMGYQISNNCSDFGYQEGLLFCDYSCSYDYSNCKYIKKEEPTKEEIVVEKETIIEKVISYLPIILRTFDFDRDGKFGIPEFKTFIKEWVDNWKIFKKSDEESKPEVKGACDINGDKACNVLDFSIILYYVDYD